MAGWTSNTPPATRIRGRKLQQLRARLFARAPWCALCLLRGRQTRATIRDHKVPLAEGGRDVESNTHGICVDCDRVKTRDESARGVRRQ